MDVISLTQHVCGHPVELKSREHMENRWEDHKIHSEDSTQKPEQKISSLYRGTGVGAPLIVPLPLSLRIASFSVLERVHSSPSARRRGAAAAEVTNASAAR